MWAPGSLFTPSRERVAPNVENKLRALVGGRDFVGAQAGQVTLTNAGMKVISVLFNSQGLGTTTGWQLRRLFNR